jgi:hypothetical protein
MNEIEQAIGLGIWLTIAYLGIIYRFGELTLHASPFAPAIIISIVYIIIVFFHTLVKILFWIIRIMFDPEILILIGCLFVLSLLGFVIKGAIQLTDDVHLD